MRKSLSIAAVAFAVLAVAAACSDDDDVTGVNTGLAMGGDWSVTTVNGAALPFLCPKTGATQVCTTLPSTGADTLKRELVSATMTIDQSNHTYLERRVVRETRFVGGVAQTPTNVNVEASGTWSTSNNNIGFIQTIPSGIVSFQGGTVAADVKSFTVQNPPASVAPTAFLTIVYTKK